MPRRSPYLSDHHLLTYSAPYSDGSIDRRSVLGFRDLNLIDYRLDRGESHIGGALNVKSPDPIGCIHNPFQLALPPMLYSYRSYYLIIFDRSKMKLRSREPRDNFDQSATSTDIYEYQFFSPRFTYE